jgi:hypothetical protein
MSVNFQFEFEFDYDTTPSYLTKQFHISNLDWDNELTSSDEFVEQTEELEEYGVHDFFGQDDHQNTPVIGFHSYEISRENADLVVSKWKEWFESQGCECSEIIDL